MKVAQTSAKQRQWREMGRFERNLKAELTGLAYILDVGVSKREE